MALVNAFCAIINLRLSLNYTKMWRRRPRPVEAIRCVRMVGTIYYKPLFPWLGLTANAMVGLGGVDVGAGDGRPPPIARDLDEIGNWREFGCTWHA